MKRLMSPLIQMTMALVGLASMLIILGSLLLGVIPDREAAMRTTRQSVADTLSVQVAERLGKDEVQPIEKTLRHIVNRTPDLRSVGVRRADGQLLLDTGKHASQWTLGAEERSSINQFVVPLSNEGQRWGRVELVFADRSKGLIGTFFAEPLVQLLLFMTLAGWLVFGLYMRRALQHLDPSSVVPARVQGAFDTMAEGIVVLDAKGRIMMCNSAFRELDESLHSVPLGSRLAQLPWFEQAFAGDTNTHPWSRAMSERAPNSGNAVDVNEGSLKRRFILNAAPISEPSGAVRGCMVTINDMTAQHRANEALQEALQALHKAKSDVDQKNLALEQLATRDPLTGVMNRRALHDAFESLQAQAKLTQQPLACLMIDIDHFKAVNDNHGHGVGDRVIQAVARRLQDSLRSTDLVGRWGGEEFCVVTLGLEGDALEAFAERIRKRVEREAGAAVREPAGLRVTCSVGVSVNSEASMTLDMLVDHADRELYKAKRAGRNRTEGQFSDRPLGKASSPSQRRHGDRGTPATAVDAQGWLAARKRLLMEARSEDRSVACLCASFDENALASRGQACANEWIQNLTRWMLSVAPDGSAVTTLGNADTLLLVKGVGLEEAQELANDMLRLAQAEQTASQGDSQQGDVAAALTLCIGVDALPASAPGAATLPERAARAMARCRRSQGAGVVLFAPGVGAGVAQGATP